jgi:hypothetical protein
MVIETSSDEESSDSSNDDDYSLEESYDEEVAIRHGVV